MLDDVTKEVTIVTGPGRAIRDANASRYPLDGAQVAFWECNTLPLNRATATLHAMGADPRPNDADIADAVAVEQAGSETRSHFGDFHQLINNDGTSSSGYACSNEPATVGWPGYGSRARILPVSGSLHCMVQGSWRRADHSGVSVRRHHSVR